MFRSVAFDTPEDGEDQQVTNQPAHDETHAAVEQNNGNNDKTAEMNTYGASEHEDSLGKPNNPDERAERTKIEHQTTVPLVPESYTDEQSKFEHQTTVPLVPESSTDEQSKFEHQTTVPLVSESSTDERSKIEHQTTVPLVPESSTDNQPDQALDHIDNNSNCQELIPDNVRQVVDGVDIPNRDHDKTNEAIIENKALLNEKPASNTSLTVELNSGRRDSTSRRVSFPNLKGSRRFL